MSRLTTVTLSLLLVIVTGCNPLYVARAGYEEMRILMRRQPISKLVNDDSVPKDMRQKLSLVAQARSFAIERGLKPEGAFLYYSELDRNQVSWLLTAVKELSFTPKKWWFPVVGSVPYKGFFDREDARREAQRLNKLGYETNIRPVEAFSTLGWFDDPVLSPLLERSEENLVRTVLHEIVHSTYWVPGEVDFNESLAEFLALQEHLKFFKQRRSPAELEELIRFREGFFRAAAQYEGLYQHLKELFSSDLSEPQKRQGKAKLYTEYLEQIRSEGERFLWIKEANNATLLDMVLYLQGFDLFANLYQQAHQNPATMLAVVSEIHSSQELEEGTMFQRLASYMAAPSAKLANRELSAK